MNAANSTSFQIEGMTCASCVGRVEKALSAVAGVANASVNLATETAIVSYDDAVDTKVLTKTLADVGYPAITEEVTLEIEAMTCASCVGRVEKALKAGTGVLEASVNRQPGFLEKIFLDLAVSNLLRAKASKKGRFG